MRNNVTEPVPAKIAAWEKKFHTLPKLEDNLQINFTELTFSGMKNNGEDGQKGGQKSDQKGDQKSDQKSDQKIIMAIKENPKITRAELQNITGLSESGVKKILRQLQQKGLLSRIGPDKGGHWEIIDK